MSDTGYPNFLKIGTDGKVNADFSGHVHASGIDLDAVPGAAGDPAQRVGWERTSDGALVAQVYGFADEVSAIVGLMADLPGIPSADLRVRSSSIAGRTDITAFGGATKLMDDLGYSSFVQLLGGPTKLRVAYGSVVVRLTGGGAYFASIAVNHGLGSAPVFAHANARSSIGLQVVDAKVQSPTPTQINVLAYVPNGASPSATTDITCDWIALG